MFIKIIEIILADVVLVLDEKYNFICKRPLNSVDKLLMEKDNANL